MRYLTVLALLQITSVFAQVSNSRLPMLLADTSLFEKPVYVQTTKQEAKQQVKIRELKILVHKKKKNYPKIDSLLSLGIKRFHVSSEQCYKCCLSSVIIYFVY